MRSKRFIRWAGPLAAGLVVVAQVVGFAPAASGQVFKAGQPIPLRGFATGQTLHVGALDDGETRVVNSDVAWTGASVDADADGLNDVKLNEVNRIFQSKQSAKITYARGSGLEVGLATTPSDPNQAIAGGLGFDGIAEAFNPGKPKDIKTTDIDADPVAFASLLRGTANANANTSGLVPDVCVLGDDLSRGTGHATDVQLLDAGDDEASEGLDAAVVAANDQDPDRSVSFSKSHTKLVPTGKPNNFGLMSEVRMTIAPVTLLQNRVGEDPRTITIEALGEWVLRVSATGSPGGAKVFYGPGTTNLDTPILRIISSDGAVSEILKFQDIFGDEGLAVSIPGVLDLAIGEDPRAIAKPGEAPNPDSKPLLAANGTKASAAVDVVRIRAIGGQIADLRVGHMEVSTEVPAGGVNCPIPVVKTAKPNMIRIDEEPDTSVIKITVHNVYDCDLTDTVLTDRIRQKEGDPDFQITAADPKPKSPSIPTGTLRTADVVWELGTIPKHTTRTVSMDLKSAERGGVIRDIATAVGKMANCTGEDSAGLAISGLTLTGLSNPVDISIEIPRTGPATFSTAVRGSALALVALGLAWVVARRRLFRRT